MSNKIDKLQRVSLHEAWQKEERGFTRWLSENMDILSDALKIDLTAIEVEKSLPDSKFSADLIAQDRDRKTYIIENQFGKSDHDHLGKTITYLTGMDASAAIWISPDPRPEHIKAINWLNESSPADFYMVKLEAVRIGESSPAFLLTLIVGSSPEVKQAGQAKRELSEKEKRYKLWWQSFVGRPDNYMFSDKTPSAYNYMSCGVGRFGLDIGCEVLNDKCYTRLFIRIPDNPEKTRSIYDHFFNEKDSIEKGFDDKLDWLGVDGQRTCKIRYTQEGSGFASPQEKWPAIQDRLIDKMNRLEKALRPHIDSLKI